MGQQPNIELEMSDRPRPQAAPGAPRRWKPGRPGDLSDPAEMPWGGPYGTVGPDTGFAGRLVTEIGLEVPADENRHSAEIVVATVAGARASHFGRAPTAEDVAVAKVLFGYDIDGVRGSVVEALRAQRRRWFAGVAHHPARAREVLNAVPRDVLVATPGELKKRLQAGDQLVDL